ncbi:MAG: capsule biosynthesis protein [Paracoccaceae bacterium]
MTTPADKPASDVPDAAKENPADAQIQRGPHYYRVAMRKAKRLGLEPADEREAAKMLEDRGIDVLKEQITVMHVAQEAENASAAQKNLPATSKGDAVPATGTDVKPTAPAPMSEVERMREIAKIKRGMIRRRRMRLALLMIRLCFFVALPTFLSGYYYYSVATPMFVVETQMSVQRADPATAASAGALGLSLPNTEDSTVVQGYLSSREAMQRLNREYGFLAHFQQDFIDDIQRLPPDASLEDGYKAYVSAIEIGYDPTIGVIKMTVRAYDAETALTYSRALIAYAEARVDEMSQRVRDDQMRGAQASYVEAEAALFAAQQKVLDLQEQRGILSPDAEIQATMAVINNLSMQVEKNRLDLAEINATTSPNSSRANLLSSEIGRLEARIAELRESMTTSSNGGISLARISGELRIAETELATRGLILQSTLESLEAARVQADRQVRYLNLAVSPIAPDVTTYPRKLENTLLALIVFFGLYIFLSLTVSVLREQVNA